MKTCAYTDKGPRTENQDAFCIKNTKHGLLLAVADGVGGNRGGATASQLAISTLAEEVERGADLRQALIEAHNAITKKAQAESALEGMATTLSAVLLLDNMLVGAHCGDSRIYLLRGKGIKQLSQDHTEVARLLAEGRLTKEQAFFYPRKNLLESALGTNKKLILQEFECALQLGDRLLLSTDGAYSVTSKKEICELSRSENNLDLFYERLVDKVKDAGPTDNFTVIAVEI